MRRLARNVAVAAVGAVLAVAGGTLVGAGPAQAIPMPGPNQSITYHYFSNASKTTQVGMWVYGYCLEDFQWGQRTAYFTIVTTTCNSPS